MQKSQINEFVSSLSKAMDLMRSPENLSMYYTDIENIEKIKFYLSGMKFEDENLLERFFEEAS